jgi:hypothetical protein
MAVPDDMNEFVDKVVMVTGAAGNLDGRPPTPS